MKYDKRRTVPLSQVCTLNMGQSPSSDSYNENKDGLPFFQGNADFGNIYPKERVWCSQPTKIASKDDILLSVRAPIGALNIAKEECCIGRGLAALSPIPSQCRMMYLFYALKSKVKILEQQGTGSTFKAVGKDIISALHIPLYPLEEQEHIIRMLSCTDKGIANIHKQLAKLDTLVKSRFIEMFGDPHHSTIFPYKKVKDFTEVRSGGTPSRKQDSYWRNGSIRWVKTTELQNNEIYDTEEKITQEALEHSSAKLVPKATVLIAMYGQGKTRGMTAYLKEESTTNQACACILPSDSINQRYLWRYFMMSYEQLRELAQGAGQPNLTGEMIKNFPVLMPPKILQEQYVAFAELADKSELVLQKLLEKQELLRAALMQEYLG